MCDSDHIDAPARNVADEQHGETSAVPARTERPLAASNDPAVSRRGWSRTAPGDTRLSDTHARTRARRAGPVLAGAAGLGASLGLPGTAPQLGPLSLATGAGSADDSVLHLVRRATFGLTPGLIDEVATMGAQRWLDDQLRPDGIADPMISFVATRYPLLGATAAELDAAGAGDQQRVIHQLVEATLARQIWSRRQLAEVMIDFWSNHFNVTTPLGMTRTTKPVEDATVIRRHALGRFEDLLLADAKSPAMLIYLGNAVSRSDDPNENYGRELLELHTVGIDAGYTEDDVRNSAYVLTGWGVDGNSAFRFDPSAHYVGPVAVLGWSAPNDSADQGLAVGEDYLRYLARHEQTARHLSHKLAVRFVSDDPPQSLVSRLAKTYLSADSAIVPWLHALFSSAEFATSVGRKIRRPLEDLVASVRALGIAPPADGDTTGFQKLYGRSRQLGQPPLGAPAPTGYDDVAAAWLSTSGSLARWNVHRHLARDIIPGLLRRPALLVGDPPASMGALVDRLTMALTGQVFRAEHRSVLLAFLGAEDSDPYNAEAVSKSVNQLVALILDSPYHLLR